MNITDYRDTVLPDDPSEIAMGLNRIGYMPNEMLVRKFEETDVEPDEDLFYNFTRETLADRGPDTQLFAEEETRYNNGDNGLINLRYNGVRGEAEPAAHPEMFLGFAGPENRDPRGHRDEPDFTKYREQLEARNRLQRMDNDAGNENQITGLQRSQYQVMRDIQYANDLFKKNTKIFTTSRLNMDSGKKMAGGGDLRKNESEFSAFDWDKIKETTNFDTINPSVIKYKYKKPESVNDQDYSIMRYNALYSGSKVKQKRLTNETSADMGNSCSNETYKRLAAVIKDNIRRKQETSIDPSESRESQQRINNLIRDIRKNRKNHRDGEEYREEMDVSGAKLNRNSNIHKLNNSQKMNHYTNPMDDTILEIYKRSNKLSELNKSREHAVNDGEITYNDVESAARKVISNNGDIKILRKKTEILLENDSGEIASYKKIKQTELNKIAAGFYKTNQEGDFMESTQSSNSRINKNVHTGVKLKGRETMSNFSEEYSVGLSAPALLTDVKRINKHMEYNTHNDNTETISRGRTMRQTHVGRGTEVDLLSSDS